jgi:hypothetical protein
MNAAVNMGSIAPRYTALLARSYLLAAMKESLLRCSVILLMGTKPPSKYHGIHAKR